MPAVSAASRARPFGRVPPGVTFRTGLPALLLLCCVLPAAAAQTPGLSASPGRRVVTNKQLEPFRLRRAAQEEEYERTRQARGLPSREELRRQAEERDRRLFEWARQAEADRREAELAALWSELVTARRQLHDSEAPPSWAPGFHEASYVSTDFYPYFYAPPIRFSLLSRRGHSGHRNFWLPPMSRGWPHGARRGHLFRPNTFGPRLNSWARPRVPPLAMPSHRRPR